jgi:hypothetical protein
MLERARGLMKFGIDNSETKEVRILGLELNPHK